MTTANRPAMEVDVDLTANAAVKVREFMKAEKGSRSNGRTYAYPSCQVVALVSNMP